MNWLDIVLGIIIFISLIYGAIKGFIRELFGLIGIFLAFYVARKLYARFATVLPLSVVISKVLSFVMIFIVVFLLVYLIGFLIYSLVRVLKLGPLDKFLGLIFGVIKGLFLCAILCLFISVFPAGKKAVNHSRIAQKTILPIIYRFFPKDIKKKVFEIKSEKY